VASGIHARDAAELAKVDIARPYQRRKEEPAFAKAWDEAKQVGREELEAEANRRAYHGVLEPQYFRGEIIGHVRRYSDELLKFLLRANNPDKFAKFTKSEVSGPGGAPLQAALIDVSSDDFKALPADERIRRLREAINERRSAASEPVANGNGVPQ